MNKKVKKEDAGRETPEVDNEAEQNSRMLSVDSGILRLFGLRHEIQDDIIKIWPHEVQLPDETNWLLGDRFSMHLGSSLNILSGLKVSTAFHSCEDEWWAIVTFETRETVMTTRQPTLEMAGAHAAFAALYCKKYASSAV